MLVKKLKTIKNHANPNAREESKQNCLKTQLAP